MRITPAIASIGALAGSLAVFGAVCALHTAAMSVSLAKVPADSG